MHEREERVYAKLFRMLFLSNFQVYFEFEIRLRIDAFE